MKKQIWSAGRLVVVLILAGMAFGSQTARAQEAGQACDGGEGVYLYELNDYQGRCVKYTADAADLSTKAFNNITSSIRLVGSWTATLYVDQNYNGNASTFIEDDSNLSNNNIGDNRASSIRVQRGELPEANICNGDDGVYLYEHRDYKGRCVKFTSNKADISTLSFNNIASSIRLVGSWTATLYVDQNYSGQATTFTRSDPDLGNDAIGDNQASSIRVQQLSVPATNACDGGEGAYLYEHPQYAGRCVKFTGDAPDLRTVGFDDAASSVRIVGSWNVTLYRDLSGTGIASPFTGDDPDLSNNAIGDNQATSLTARRTGTSGGGAACDGGEGLYMYEHPQYAGRCVKFTGDAPDLRTVGFDDVASSVRIVGSWSATLYRDLSGTGIASTFTGDDPDLSNNAIGDNQATSLTVRRAGSGAACDGGEGVYLYEHPQYQGRCVKFTGDASDLRTVGFDDVASSVRIVGSWSVTLYRDLSGTGIASTFTSDDSDLSNNTIGDNQVTSLTVRRR